MNAAQHRDRGPFIPYPHPLATRLLSLMLAVALVGLILAYPRALADTGRELRQILLPLLMWGLAAGFVHGVGFVPRFWAWRLLFHPFLGWLLLSFGAAWVILNR